VRAALVTFTSAMRRTCLPNRAKLRAAIMEAIGHEQETQQLFALLIVELTRFRDINYTLGQLIGDAVPRQASLRIASVATAAGQGDDPDDLVRHADIAAWA
jgi:GGDEF domain-containing protein